MGIGEKPGIILSSPIIGIAGLKVRHIVSFGGQNSTKKL